MKTTSRSVIPAGQTVSRSARTAACSPAAYSAAVRGRRTTSTRGTLPVRTHRGWTLPVVWVAYQALIASIVATIAAGWFGSSAWSAASA